MREMFNGCESLHSLPDISNWNIENVINMSYMFWRCKSLKSLPDISNWNTENLKDMSYIFEGCKSLKKVGNNNFSDFKFHWNMKFSNK